LQPEQLAAAARAAPIGVAKERHWHIANVDETPSMGMVLAD